MSTTKISVPVIKRLFALSGNACCYPGCQFKVIHGETVLAHIAHIKSDRPGGPRYESSQTEEERQGFDNLMLLCPTHHTIVDGDVIEYPVERLNEMKAKHAQRQGEVLSAEEIERGTELLLSIAAAVSSIGQSGGITAHTVNQTNIFPPGESGNKPANNATLSTLALPLHQKRIRMVKDGQPVPTIHTAAILLEVFPAAALLNQDYPAASNIYSAKMGFRPLDTTMPLGVRISTDGFLTGSHADGLDYPQRTYTYVSETGIVSAVNSDVDRGQEGNFLLLRDLHHLVVEGVHRYVSTLVTCGFTFPMVIMASLVGVTGLRLVHRINPTTFLEDCPGARIDDDVVSLGSQLVEGPIPTMQATAEAVRPMLDRLSRAAGLARSPYYDDNRKLSL
jgi:hypothetical protein